MSPPLTPTADEARHQLELELAKPEYLDTKSWLARLFERLLDWLSGLDGPGWSASDWVALAITGGVLAAVVCAIGYIAGPLRRERKLASAGVLAGEDRTAAELRDDAAQLAGRGAWAEAILQRFRAIVRALSERVIVHETPGMTAHEAALQAAARLPALAAGLVEGAGVFDAIAYGGRPGTEAQYEAMADLDGRVAQTRPERVTALAAAAVDHG
jgi:hypothetical protein